MKIVDIDEIMKRFVWVVVVNLNDIAKTLHTHTHIHR